ncbi:MAG: Ig-like domain-containing protein [Bacillaceae bacterium]|nr:Ig-like domain-containing protein [Bacillaceae bacterium]
MIDRLKRFTRLLVVFVLMMSSFPTFTNGQEQQSTLVGGTLTEDTVWTKEGSPYELRGILTIPTGVTLTVEPGVRVVGYIGSWIRAEGKFIAIGTDEERISLDTAYVLSTNFPETYVHIEHADVRRGGNGGYLVSGANLYLKNNTFTNGSVNTLTPKNVEPVIMNNLFQEKATVDLTLGTVDTILVDNTFLSSESTTNSDIKISCKNDCTGPNLVMSGNNFFRLGRANFNIQSDKVLQFDGTNNYWGTTELAKINLFVLDANDYSGGSYRGLLVVEPIAFKPFDHGHPLGEFTAPLVHPVGDNQQTVTGLTDADSEVEVWNGDVLVGTNHSLADGTFSVRIPAQVAGSSLTVLAKDSFHRQSAIAQTVVADKTPPNAPVVHELTDAMEYVTGTAEPNAIITVLKNDAVFARERADEHGAFHIFIEKQPADTVFVLYAEDASGNKSEQVTVTVFDVTPPNKPVLTDEITETSDFIRGKVEPGAMVYVKANGVELFRQRADMFGQFGTFIATQKAGTTIEIVAEDAAGNKSEPLIVQVKDNRPPYLYVYRIGDNTDKLYGVTELGAEVTVKKDGVEIGRTVVSGDTEFSVTIGRQMAGTKLVVTSKDKAGNATTVEAEVFDLTPPGKPVVHTVTDKSTIVTGTAEAASVVEVYRGTTIVGSARTSDSGTFSVNIALQKAGTVLTVKAKDNAGHVSASASVTVKDVTAPSVPQVNEVTNKATVVSGKTENGATVTVKIGTKSYSAKADSAGAYKVTIPVQNTGTELSVSVKDAAGNESGVRKVKVARVAPNVPVVKTVNNKATSVSGSAEKYANVTVKIGTQSYTSKADSTGAYKVTIPVQNAGTTLSITAKDSAGKISVARNVTVTRVAPNMPVVNTVNNKASTVSGKTEKYAVVSVKIGTKVYSSKADVNGNYKVTIPVQNSDTSLSVTSKDSTGAVSYAKTMKVVRVAPNVPTVNAVYSYSTKVTGKTEKYAVVTVKIGTRTYSAKANAYGNYSVTIPKQKKGTSISVTAKDSKGNVSAARSIKVG